MLTMTPTEKLAIRRDFNGIFNDVQDSVLRILYDMPRPLLMILRFVVLFSLSASTRVCVYVRVRACKVQSHGELPELLSRRVPSYVR